LARILEEERADVLTVYDPNGVYGHPDHVQVHRVGVRAGELARTPRVVEGTMNRDHVLRLIRVAADVFDSVDPGDRPTEEEVGELGVRESEITVAVDVREYALRKRHALAQHASQVPPDSFFLGIPDDAFVEAFGYEWFIRRDAPPGVQETDVFGD
jgi:LmbE family N-acetylglucosaminyl deacetylase